MTLPSYNQTVKDNGTGLGGTDSDSAILFVATAPAGDTNTVVLINDADHAKSLYQAGPLAEAAAYSRRSGVPTYACRIDTAEVGTFGSVTKSPAGGGATLAFTGSEPIDNYDCKVKVVAGGAMGAATIAISLDNGATWSKTITATTPYALPASLFKLGADPGITLVWTGTLQTGDVYSFAAYAPQWTSDELNAALDAINADPKVWRLGMVLGADPALGLSAVSSSGASPPAVTVTGTPADSAYNFRLEITTGGAVATAVFRWSSNGGSTWTSSVTTATTCVLGSTGVTVHFPAGTYATSNVYRWTPVLSEAQASLAILDTKASAAFAAKKRYRIGLQLAEVAGSCLAATVDGLDYERVSVAAGLDKVKSDLTSRYEWRPHGQIAVVRAGAGGVSEDPASGVTVNPLRSVTAISRDEAKATTSLDDARIITARTWEGRQNEFYVSNYWTLAAEGSDYQLIQYGRIMDVACDTTYQRMLKYSSSKVPRSLKTKKITEVAARNIEEYLTSALRGAVVTPGHADDASVIVNRTDDLSGPTATLRWKTSVQPQGYAKHLEEELSLSL